MKKILIVFFIFLLAFSVRLIYISRDMTPIRPESDEGEYDRLAMCLVESKGYINSTDGSPTSLRPPFYPASLSVIYRIFGHDYFIAKIIQAVFGSLTICLLYLIAQKIFNKITAIFAGIFSSFYMPFVACTDYLYTETLFTFLLVLATFLIINIRENLRPIKFIILGLLLGIMTLVRSIGFFVPLIAIFVLFPEMKDQRPILKKIILPVLVLFVSFSAVILPWTIRNYKVHNRFVLVSTNAGLNMYQAINPLSGKIFGWGPRDGIAKEADAILDDAERNRFFMRQALESYKADPLRAMKMLIMRFLFFWCMIDWEIMGGETINYHYIFILPFAFLGTLYALKDKKRVSFILLVILYFTSTILLFQGTPRYRLPIDGYIILLGSYGIYKFISGKKNKIYPVLCIGGYFILSYLFYKYSLATKAFIKTVLERIGLW